MHFHTFFIFHSLVPYHVSLDASSMYIDAHLPSHGRGPPMVYKRTQKKFRTAPYTPIKQIRSQNYTQS